ncbi:Uncharacterized protein dnm_033740 [Desulfonema magnum]|uniref:Uncharacterized protein n=1 Tax=Desulfonema magnum TaxID=45655 RepID=A0A975GN40_9BACT|nr:Uncharacterized protein dnm_033740 [Desulfonema magnum]
MPPPPFDRLRVQDPGGSGVQKFYFCIRIREKAFFALRKTRDLP